MYLRKNLIAAITVSLCVSSLSSAYEIPNHADMSQTAADLSLLASDVGPNGKLVRLGLRNLILTDGKQTFALAANLPQIPMCFGIARAADGTIVPDPSNQPPWGTGINGLTQLTIANLFRYGACYEDNVDPIGGVRVFAHFYDPQQQGAGLSVGRPSPDWMLNGSFNVATGANHYGWNDARAALYRALTFRSTTGLSAEDDARARSGAWATTFQALGHIIHHLQDMAQPQHTRLDDHCDSGLCYLAPQTHKPSGYEKHMLNNRFEFVRTLAASATTPMWFGLPREYWNAVVPINQPLTGAANLTGHRNPNEGMAAYSATNFVTAGTNFRTRFDGSVYTTVTEPNHPFPQPGARLESVPLETLFADAAPQTLDTIKNALCKDVTPDRCVMKFIGTQQEPTARTAATSTFAPELFNPSGAFVGDTLLGAYSQNWFTYDHAAAKLVPAAVNYSAGLINYFFRGELEIKLPEEGVYGIVDHAVENNKNAHGFRLIKAKVKNTTPPVTMNYPRQDGTSIIPQHMTGGSFVAVAKFRRNICYTPDLTGQIGTVGQGASARTNTAAACRSAVDEIVVSAPATEWSGGGSTSGTAIAAQQLDAGSEKTLSFDFSANPIPIEATDLYLQVVFKGKLGEEIDAVAVGTQDVSEPSFVSLMESSDYRLCAASWVNGNDDGSDPIGCANWNPDLGERPVVQSQPLEPLSWHLRAWKTPEYARWFGFHDAQNKNVVVARLPDDGLVPGSFVRLAVIAAADNQPLILSYSGATNSNLPYSRRLSDGEFAVNDAEYWRLITYVKKTVVQADDEGVVNPTSLPSYWQARSVVLSAKTEWPGEGSNALLPTLAIYRGEPLWSTPADQFLVGVTSQAANTSVLNGDYYPAINNPPQAFGLIAFGTGPANRVPATWLSIKRERNPFLQNDLADTQSLWQYLYPRKMNGRHRMSPRATELEGYVEVLRP